MEKYKDIDTYISSFNEDIRTRLMLVKNTIEKTAPEAVASISYGMPAYKLNGRPLAYFAANKKHLGFYPTSGVIAQFETELIAYKSSKGAVQFPYDKELPISLIKKLLKFRIAQISA